MIVELLPPSSQSMPAKTTTPLSARSLSQRLWARVRIAESNGFNPRIGPHTNHPFPTIIPPSGSEAKPCKALPYVARQASSINVVPYFAVILSAGAWSRQFQNFSVVSCESRPSLAPATSIKQSHCWNPPCRFFQSDPEDPLLPAVTLCPLRIVFYRSARQDSKAMG